MEGVTDDLDDVLLYSTLNVFIFLGLSVRDVIVAVATLFCVALSMVNGGASITITGACSTSRTSTVCTGAEDHLSATRTT